MVAKIPIDKIPVEALIHFIFSTSTADEHSRVFLIMTYCRLNTIIKHTILNFIYGAIIIEIKLFQNVRLNV